jgi:hypothetical protein
MCFAGRRAAEAGSTPVGKRARAGGRGAWKNRAQGAHKARSHTPCLQAIGEISHASGVAVGMGDHNDLQNGSRKHRVSRMSWVLRLSRPCSLGMLAL